MTGRSRFLFAYECQFAASCTQNFGIESFLGYLRFIEQRGRFLDGPGTSPWMTQSYLLRQQCGQPCRYDNLFHTSSMQADWLALMNELGEPRTLLPLPADKTRVTPDTPPTNFSHEVLEIIHRIDSNMFEEWGFAKRDRPFELGDAIVAKDRIHPITIPPLTKLTVNETQESQAESQAAAQAVAEMDAVGGFDRWIRSVNSGGVATALSPPPPPMLASTSAQEAEASMRATEGTQAAIGTPSPSPSPRPAPQAPQLAPPLTASLRANQNASEVGHVRLLGSRH